MASPPSQFRERAKIEADRYGPDPWVFVRELLQNARDAGARTVSFYVEERGIGTPEATTRIRCRDDGEGMTFDHARRYLFSLYASSKEGRRDQVGRFGVGFWSVLRFEPARIVIRSCAEGASAWEIELDGELEHARRREVAMTRGTEIVLEKRAADGDQIRRMLDAAQQNGRFLRRRDDPTKALEIDVNGQRVNEPFALPPPSATFDRGGVRGVVGLGRAPRVELFSRGLRVRSAACLDDLLSETAHTTHSRVRFPELPGSLAPQALLEADDLDLLLSRSDARDDRALRRLVRLANNELRLLVEHQLDRIRPPGVVEILAAVWRRVMGESTLRRALVSAAFGGTIALVAARFVWPTTPTHRPIDDPPASSGVVADESAPRAPNFRYGDLSARYRGPQVGELDPSRAEPVALRYSPAAERPYLTALVVEDVAGAASSTSHATDEPYLSLPCTEGCLEVALAIDAPVGLLRIPVPTGHRLDVSRTRLDDAPVTVLRTSADEPYLALARPHTGTLRYSTSPGIPRDATEVAPAPELPSDLAREARRLRRLPREVRVERALDLVRARVRYETSAETAAAHHRAIAAGIGFIPRSLEIGAGDCDVQNGLVVAILHAADVPARLAVGYVGDGAGGVSPWLHAWVEWRTDEGPWVLADATAQTAGIEPPIAAPPVPEQTGEAPVTDSTPVPALAQTEPAADEPPTPRGFEIERRHVLATLGSLGVAAFVLVFVLLRSRTRRTVSLDERGNLAALLQGALAQPGAFRHLPALLHRHLVPLRDGRATSLSRVRTLASEGRLFAASGGSGLVVRAARRGIPILDGATPEGRAVARALGATDLDRWSDLLRYAREPSLLEAVNGYLRTCDTGFHVRATKHLGERVTTLDLQALRVARRDRKRVVLLDADDPWFAEARRLHQRRPAAAVFALLDHVFDHLDIDPKRRARLLAPQALAVIVEADR
jgi:transglutaminase-like putative cysteine protease